MRRSLFVLLAAAAWLGGANAAAQASYRLFEAGQVRPLALTPDGTKLLALNTPDDRLEIFEVDGVGNLTHTGSVRVGMRPVAVAARTNDSVWVVNHLSDSVSVVALSPTPRVTRTLLVGDEPRDIVFAGPTDSSDFFTRAFISTAHRGQHRSHASIAGVTGAGDPELTTEGVGRADVWVFDVGDLAASMAGVPRRVLSFFADTPRALATDGSRVYVAAFHSGNQTTTIAEIFVCDGFDDPIPFTCLPDTPGGVPGPSTNAPPESVPAPETGLIVKFDPATGTWRDAIGRDWSEFVDFELPDHDVFSINATLLLPATVREFDHVGTTLFNMAVNPVSGRVYVTNTESPNDVRFEGPGNHGGSTVQGHLSESRITVIDTETSTVFPQHLNQHIDYDRLHTDVPDLVDPTAKNHSLATPVDIVVSSDGETIYTAAFGSPRVGVFSRASIEDPLFAANFDPAVESANYIRIGGGPSGLALHEGHDRLYVLTRFDNSVTAIDLSTRAKLQTIALHSPEDASIIEGRRFLYDAFKTSGNGEASCASCHIFGDTDDLAWNLGNPDAATSTNSQPAVNGAETSFHPMKGPMTTQTLRGMASHGGMHWRGDRVDGFFGLDPCSPDPSGSPCDEDHSFRNFIVAFEGLVGRAGPISHASMQKFSDFALQIMLPPNPVRALDDSLTPTQLAGRDIFLNDPDSGFEGIKCADCHELDPAKGFFGSGSLQADDEEAQHFKVAQLRNVYQKVGMFRPEGGSSGEQVRGYGLLHDGSIDTVSDFLRAGVFDLDDLERANVEQFLLAFDSDLAPVVGQQVTLHAGNHGEADTHARIDLLMERATTAFTSLMLGGAVTECDLIAKLVEGGVPRGFLLLTAGPPALFQPDDTSAPISNASLRDKALIGGQEVTYTCVPPGSGFRSALDRDEDALLNGVETNTGVFVSPGDTGSDPARADTDSDGFDDGEEVAAGRDPNDPLDFPNESAVVPALSPTGSALLLAALVGAAAGALRRSRRDRR